MSTRGIPTTEELYEEASRISSEHVERHESSDFWGGRPHEESLSNVFVWDLQPDRFYHDDNVPDEIVVLPNVYGGFVDGKGFSLMTPLSNYQDRSDAEEVLGDEMIDEFEDGVPAVIDVDTPEDVMEMHYMADRMDVDVYRLPGFDEFLGSWMEDDPEHEEWSRLADRGLESFVRDYTRPSQGRYASEAIDEFAGNGNRTAFVLYAEQDSESFPEDTLYEINEKNEGGLAYHTPKTMTQVLKNDLLEK